MSKMTDEQIKKALECCGKNVLYENCGDCPYEKDFGKDHICTIKVARDALDLINRQQAEVKRLKEEVASKSLKCSLLEREKAENISGFVDDLKLVRTEAIKECLEWVLSLFPKDKSFTTISRFTINQKLKEMVGEGNG